MKRGVMNPIVQTASGPEEVSRTCQILILCEDFAAYERAKDLCWRILVQLADDLDFSFNCWNFYELGEPECTHAALRTAKTSDIILLSLHEPAFPVHAEAWLDALAGHRLHGDGLLALVLNEPQQSSAAVKTLAERVDGLARKLGMDFLLLNQPPEPDAPGTLPPRPATHGQFGEEQFDHWGLNE